MLSASTEKAGNGKRPNPSVTLEIKYNGHTKSLSVEIPIADFIWLKLEADEKQLSLVEWIVRKLKA